MANVTNVHILQDYLVAKRTHPSQISKVHREFQISKVNEIRFDKTYACKGRLKKISK